MAVNTVVIPSMLNGVSTQAAQLRLATQGEEMKNGYATLQKGLGKRPPTVFVSELTSLGDMDQRANIHMINRDEDEKYVVVLTGGADRDLKVFDLEGEEQTVNFPDGKGYLDNSNPRDNFKLVTVADYTFVLNTQQVVEADSATSPSRSPEALVHILAGNYGRAYNIRINAPRAAEYVTPDGSSNTHTNYVDPIVIARVLLRGLQHDGTSTALENGDTPSGDGGGGLYVNGRPSDSTFNSGEGTMWYFGSGDYDSGDWESRRFGTAIHIRNTAEDDFEITVDDGFNGNAMKAIQRSTQRFSNLPVDAPNNYVVEVTGESSNSFDNYWVRFDRSRKVWEETVEPDIEIAFDPSTMPHVLVREADGTFTFQEADWSERTVGDAESNPYPSFLDQRINDLAFHRNRLVLLAGENVIMSRHGEYFNFFRETVTTIIDTDPIDVGISTRKVATLNHAVPMDEDLFVISSNAQFRVSSGSDLMTPRSAAIHPLSNYLADVNSVPLVLGDKVYFSSNMGSTYSMVREMWIEHNVQPEHRQLDTTSHCPGYVRPDIYRMVGSAENEVMFALNTSDRTRLDVYKFHWTDSEDKPQSAWGHWTLPGAVYGGDVVQNDLILLMSVGGTVAMVAAPLEVGYTDDGTAFAVHLDLRAASDHPDVNVVFNTENGLTTYDLPYTLGSAIGDLEVWTAPGGTASSGLFVSIQSISDMSTFTRVRLEGDWTDQPVYMGLPYEFLWRFSPIYIRDERQTGATDIIQDRQQVQRLMVSYGDTAAFAASVSPTAKGKRDYDYALFDHAVDDPDFEFDNVIPADGMATIPIMARNTEVDIELTNSTALPCWFINAEARVLYQKKFKRL